MSSVALPAMSPSMRASWRTCGRKVFYRYMAGVESTAPRRALMIGSAFHAGVEHWRKATGERSKDMAAAVAISNLHDAFHAAGIDPENDIALSQVASYVMGYLARFGAVDAGAELVESQVFEDEGDGETGYADAVVRYPDGELWVVDDKTTARFEDADKVKLALHMDDQLATYVVALRQRGIAVAGARLRQIKKTQTRLNKNETPAGYAQRVRAIYDDPTNDCYREFVMTWTDAELKLAAALRERTNLEILSHLDVTDLDAWPFNPSACLGAYGPCEYVQLCAKRCDTAKPQFKPNGKESLDGGRFKSQIWQGGSGTTSGASFVPNSVPVGAGG